ncbi:MAG: peptidylprolyl isomerase [Nitrospinota bacterium]|nr:peptidylprolyl isomerase [Nitrospinota bacterium]
MIKNNTVVSLSYNLKNSNGDELDRTGSDQPFTYLHGAGQIVPGLEDELVGMKTGDKKDITVLPEEGYGNVDPSLVMEVNRSNFPKDTEIQPGMQFASEGEGNRKLTFTVKVVDGDQVTIDGNHPLAGETLHFSVEILEIRDATQEEKNHGHAHGKGGHHH